MFKISQILSKSFAQKIQRSFSDNFLSGNNALYAEQMYASWLADNKSVHASWNAYFTNISKDIQSTQAFITQEELAKSGFKFKGSQPSHHNLELFNKVFSMINEFRRNGHFLSDLDPLGLKIGQPKSVSKEERLFALRAGLTDEEYDIPIDLSRIDEAGFHSSKTKWTPREVHDYLVKVYCGKISFEYGHISDTKVSNWIKDRVEKVPIFQKTKDEKLKLLDRILESQSFNAFCERKYSTYKRFGCEGLDSSISGIWRLTEVACQKLVKEIVVGMAHRGRLNILTCVLKKPYTQMFAEFEEIKYNDETQHTFKYAGDVKYHIGCSTKIKCGDEETILNLLPNPSHLETVYPLVLGSVKARQSKLDDENGAQVLPIIIHGDSAVAGQGVIYETQQMEKLNSFNVGGTIHVVFNNQIGFTTNPIQTRSGTYPTDIAKINENFVIHVNADEPEEVDFAMELALDYRMEFASDVYINLVGYRRPGHNEQDNAIFTQPEMYPKIQQHPPMYKLYGQKLQSENVISEEGFEERYAHFMKHIEKEHTRTLAGDIEKTNWDPYGWNDVEKKVKAKTGITEEKFLEIGLKINEIPEEFNAHKVLSKIYADRLETIKSGKNIDWATGEALAYATLLDENHSVRLSGEDSERGTFSHRHAVIHDMKTFKKYLPISSVIKNKKGVKLQIENSHLSEYGVLGFEYGHSLAQPYDLTIWEAQFGDFINGAQIVVDQYIMTGEKKWLKKTNLVLLLPHGYDGQGPEHSNARLERFLSNIADDIDLIQKDKTARNESSMKTNAIILNITNPANFFHALRRQVNTHLRKPVIVFSPKRILKHKLVRSTMSEFLGNSEFIRIYDDDLVDKQKAKLILFCSGQIYFDLLEYKEQHNIENVAILRLEQIAPFPYNTFSRIIAKYNKNAQVRWVSEEHRNFGAYSFVQPRANVILKEHEFDTISYVGRAISATTATGSNKQHKLELAQLLKEAFE